MSRRSLATLSTSIHRVPATANNSILSLFATAMSYSLTVNNSRASIPHVMIANSGALRFNVYAGPFTKNDQITASPFTNDFVYIPNVTLSVATQVLPTMNDAGKSQRRGLDAVDLTETEAYARGEVDMLYRAWLEQMGRRSFGPERREADNATLGYVTHDVSLSGLTIVVPFAHILAVL